MLTDKAYKRLLLLMVGGLLTGLTLAVPPMGILQWVTLIPVGLVLLSMDDTGRLRLHRAYGSGVFYFMCYYLVVFHWFVGLGEMDFVRDLSTGERLSLLLAACVGVSLVLSLLGGLLFVLLRLVFRTPLMKKHPLLRPLAAAMGWAIFEWTQTLPWWGGFPWGILPIGQTDYPLGLQTASLFGPYFITFLLVAVNMYLAYALRRTPGRRLAGLWAAGLLLANYGFGGVLCRLPAEEGDTLRVGVLQSNISSNEKWESASREDMLAVYEAQALSAARQGAELIVFPETALPFSVTSKSKTGQALSALAEKTRATLLAGCLTPAGEDGLANALLCVQPDGRFLEQEYAKRRLVPFGEYVPMQSVFEVLLPPLTKLVLGDGTVLPGQGAQLLPTDGAVVGGLICFDSIYDAPARESVAAGAQLLVLATNDSWFGDSAALTMHLAHTQLRAIESGRYMVVAASTGLSAVISPTGEVVGRLEPHQPGVLVADVPVQNHRTLYSCIGNGVLWLFGGLLAVTLLHGAAVCLLRKKHRETA